MPSIFRERAQLAACRNLKLAASFHEREATVLDTLAVHTSD